MEEHLPGFEVCGRRLRWVIDVAEATRALSRHSLLRVVVSDARAPPAPVPGSSRGECRLRRDPRGRCDRRAPGRPLQAAGRTDLMLCDASGQAAIRLADIALPALTPSGHLGACSFARFAAFSPAMQRARDRTRTLTFGLGIDGKHAVGPYSRIESFSCLSADRFPGRIAWTIRR